MDAATPAADAVRAVVDAYGAAVYYARAEVFEEMCHERFQMTHIEGDRTTFWDKAGYLDRVRGRSAHPGAASYGVYSVDVAGDEIARAHLWVDVPPVRYEDHLGFVKVAGQWKLLTKVFRTMDGPEREG